MNWKLIFQLSIFGLAMAFGTVSLISSQVEPFFWLGIFILCAIVIARVCNSRYFAHGFMLSVFNGLWITAVHVGLYHDYIANHPEMLDWNKDAPWRNHPRLFMLVSGPILGAVFGLIQGLFAWIASKALPKEAAPPAKKSTSKKAKS